MTWKRPFCRSGASFPGDVTPFSSAVTVTEGKKGLTEVQKAVTALQKGVTDSERAVTEAQIGPTGPEMAVTGLQMALTEPERADSPAATGALALILSETPC
jgi:hypothetical protein